jgi:tetratricopeptide (TPR) repeat protein
VQIGNQALDGHMLFGAGPDSFSEIWSKYMPAEISQTAFWQVDFAYGIGFIPTAVIATGLIGLLTWLVFFGVFGYMGVKSFFAARNVDRGDVVHYLRITSFVGALYLWIISLIQVPSPVLVIYAFILTGMFVASYSFGDDAVRSTRIVFEENPRAGFLVTLGLTFVILASVGGTYSVFTRFSAESAYQKAVRVVNTSGDLAQAEELLNAAIGRHPVDTYYRLLSNIDLVYVDQLLKSGQAPEAIREDFQRLLARSVSNAQRATVLDERSHQNWLNFATIYQSIVPLGIEGSAESAVSAFDKALELRPNAANIYLSKATLERSRGDNEAARALVEKAISLRGQYTNAIFLLAQMQLEQDSTAEAIQSVEAITLFEPANPVAHFQLGLLKYGTDDFTGAIQSLETAVAYNPEYANARYFLGLAYWRLGSLELSRRQFEEVLRTNPDNAEVQSIITNLSAGRDPFQTETASEDIGERDGLPLEGEANAQDSKVLSPEAEQGLEAALSPETERNIDTAQPPVPEPGVAE